MIGFFGIKKFRTKLPAVTPSAALFAPEQSEIKYQDAGFRSLGVVISISLARERMPPADPQAQF